MNSRSFPTIVSASSSPRIGVEAIVPVAPKQSHIPALDGVRGLAILLVLAHHFTYYGGLRPGALVDTLFYFVTMAGWFGVDLFFVLSGFLITGILYDAKGTNSFFRNFYVRRSLRIFPLYYGVLALYFVVVPLLVTPETVGESYQSFLGDQAWYWTYLANVKIAFDGWPRFNSIAHFWSLAIEEQFYLLWPVVVFWLRRHTLIKVCIACILLALSVRIGSAWMGQFLPAYVLAPSRMDALAVGALLALLARGPVGLMRWRRQAWLFVTLSACVLTAAFVLRQGLWANDPVMYTGGFTVLALLFGGLLTITLTSADDSGCRTLFCSPTLRFFGRYSYGLYVFHHPIVMLLSTYFTARDVPTVLGSQLPGLMLYGAVAGGASLSVALLSWHLYERPFLRLKARFQAPAQINALAISRV